MWDNNQIPALFSCPFMCPNLNFGRTNPKESQLRLPPCWGRGRSMRERERKRRKIPNPSCVEVLQC